MIYFDHNATTPLDPRVLEAMLPYLGRLYGNPSSLYRLGRIARSAVDTAREQVAALLDAEPGQIVFTSGGSEANALALANAGQGCLLISALEHPSVFENALALPNRRQLLPTLPSGLVDLQALRATAPSPGDFASLMLANNETGAVQDVAAAAEWLRAQGGVLHCDAVQALGKLRFSFRKLGAQLLSVSSHKIYGPKGCGALAFAKGFPLRPLQRGGDQERGLRAGTENVAAIVGFGKAAELAQGEFESRRQQTLALRERLERQLRNIPGLVVFAADAPRLPNTVQFAVPGLSGEMLLMQFDRRGIAVSSGSACASGSQDSSPVLAAMGVDPALAKAAIRVSLGKDNTGDEVDRFVAVLTTLIEFREN